jgi:hypothetical protein
MAWWHVWSINIGPTVESWAAQLYLVCCGESDGGVLSVVKKLGFQGPSQATVHDAINHAQLAGAKSQS